MTMTDTRPIRFLAPGAPGEIVQRFTRDGQPPLLSYATVRDYCESAELLPKITSSDGDLKNVQRPWAIRTLLACAAPPARVLEIGGGEPIVSGFLSELGYDVTLIDPYDGFGNGPTEYARYAESFPHVRIIRDYLSRETGVFAPETFDVVLSVSVLEHMPEEALESCFDAIAQVLVPGGCSVHCFDFIVSGQGQEYARQTGSHVLALQSGLSGQPQPGDGQLDALLEHLNSDLETFYLSPQGHNSWRGIQPYDQFPFRKVVSVQTIARKPVTR